MSQRWSFLVALVVVVATLLLARLATRMDAGIRNWDLFSEMAYSVAGESFAAAPALPGGRIEQPLEPGVVVRGSTPFLFGPSPEEAVRAGEELVNPFAAAAGDAAVARGGELYGIYCIVCHDGKGDGRGTVVERGMLPPPSLHAATALGMKDGQIFHLITYGRGNMASYAAQLAPEERWKVILFVRRLQKAEGS